MLISNVVLDSFVDYKGEQSLVLFARGCNLDCDICYNKKVKAQFPEGKEALDCISEYLTSLHTAVVLTGGEPTIHDLHKTCREIKSRYPNLKIKVFTNAQKPEDIIDSSHLVDFWSIDYKTTSNDTILGGVNAIGYSYNVCRAIQILTCLKKDFIVRIWKHPKTTQEELHRMINNIQYIKADVKYELVDILK